MRFHITGGTYHFHSDGILSERALLQQITEMTNKDNPGVAYVDLFKEKVRTCSCPKVFEYEDTYLAVIHGFEPGEPEMA